MSPKKDKSARGNGVSKEIPGIFSDIKIDVNALDGNYNKGNTISSDEGNEYRPYTIFGNGEFSREATEVEKEVIASEEEVKW